MEMPKDRSNLIDEYREALIAAKVDDMSIAYMLQPENVALLSDEVIQNEINHFNKIAGRASALEERIRNLPKRIDEIADETARNIERGFKEIEEEEFAKLKDVKGKKKGDDN